MVCHNFRWWSNGTADVHLVHFKLGLRSSELARFRSELAGIGLDATSDRSVRLILLGSFMWFAHAVRRISGEWHGVLLE